MISEKLGDYHHYNNNYYNQSVAGSRRRMSGVLWNTTTGRENGLRPGKCCTWMLAEGGRKELKGHKGKKTGGEGETVKDEIIIQWNLPIKDTLEQGVLSFIERFPLFGGYSIQV